MQKLINWEKQIRKGEEKYAETLQSGRNESILSRGNNRDLWVSAKRNQ